MTDTFETFARQLLEPVPEVDWIDYMKHAAERHKWDDDYWMDGESLEPILNGILYSLLFSDNSEEVVYWADFAFEFIDRIEDWQFEDKELLKNRIITLIRGAIERPSVSIWTAQNLTDTPIHFLVRFAESLNLIDETFPASFFQSPNCKAAFLYDCLFAISYSDTIIGQNPDWSASLPTPSEIGQYLEEGFYRFPDLEEVISKAELVFSFYHLDYS